MDQKPPDIDTYILCTSPRSGSTLLTTLLRATGVAGHPASWFHDLSLQGWADGLGVPLPEGNAADQAATLIETAQQKGRAGGPLFGLRLQRQSAPFFLQILGQLHPEAPGDLSRIRARFGETRFLYLSRQDKVAQAVSYMRAVQSGLWHRAADGSELERLAPHRDPHYDAAFLSEWVATFTGYDHAWRAWFAAERITPLALTYEDLSRDPLRCLGQVLGHLDRDPHQAQLVSPGVQILSDSQSADWIARFKREARGPDRHAQP